MAIIKIPTSIGGISIPGNIINGPLSALFGNKYDITNLKYPRDLESATKGHIVKIAINEVQPTGYQEGKEYSLKTAATGIADGIGNAVKSFMGNGKDGDGTSKINLSLEPSKKRVAGTISLYMPDTVNFTYDANYGEVSMAEVGKQALTNLPGVAGKAGKSITSAIESGAGKIALKSQGLAINPNQQLLFDGIPLRSYQLAFTFTAYSQQESETVLKIIQTLKSYSRPRTVTGSGGMLFIPPATFDLQFLFNGKPNKYVNKVAESVITNVDVNYAPNGWAAHHDGAPLQIQLTLQFKEIKLIDKDKVDAGY